MDLAHELFEALVEVSIADGNTLWVDQIIKDARDAITDGKGIVSSLSSSSMNGKSFGRAVHLSPVEVLRAGQRAKRVIDDGDDGTFSSTYADFSRLQR